MRSTFCLLMILFYIKATISLADELSNPMAKLTSNHLKTFFKKSAGNQKLVSIRTGGCGKGGRGGLWFPSRRRRRARDLTITTGCSLYGGVCVCIQMRGGYPGFDGVRPSQGAWELRVGRGKGREGGSTNSRPHWLIFTGPNGLVYFN